MRNLDRLAAVYRRRRDRDGADVRAVPAETSALAECGPKRREVPGRERLARLALACAALACVVPSAAAAEVRTLERPAPAYMASKEVRERIARAGAAGVSYAKLRSWVRAGVADERAQQEPQPDPCPTVEPGTRPNSVHANACMTYPSGCTANFIYQKGREPFTGISDGRNHFIGTAGHCVDHAGQPVFMDNGSGAVIRVGEVWKHIDGGPGNDFAAVRIDKGLAIDPRMPSIGGPKGVYPTCAEGQTITWWGHGFALAVGQGQNGLGVVTNWWDRPYGWIGDALPGDSGSGVVISEGLTGAGNLTHLVIDPRYGASVVVGTRLTHILALLGGDFRLVNDDNTLSPNPGRDTRCGNPNNGTS